MRFESDVTGALASILAGHGLFAEVAQLYSIFPHSLLITVPTMNPHVQRHVRAIVRAEF